MTTTLVAPVPAADSAVDHWRVRFDPWARRGVPAHVTLLGPFLPAAQVDGEVVSALEVVFRRRAPCELVFREVAQLPGAVCLLPEEDDPLRRLTSALLHEWPELEPSSRTGGERPYHLTVACTDDPSLFADIGERLTPLLPISAWLDEAVLLTASAEGDVRAVARFPLGG